MTNCSSQKKALKGLSSQTIVTGVMGFLELLSFSILSRLLTKEEFGYYATIMSVIMIFRSLAEAGIGASVIQKNKVNLDFIDTAYTLSFVVGLIVTFIVVIFSGFFSELIADSSIRIHLLLISITIIPYSLNSIYRSLFLRDLCFFKVGIYQIIAFILSNCIAILLAAIGKGLISIVIGNLLNILFQNIILRFYMTYKPRFCITNCYVKEIVNFGGWLSLSRIVNSIYSQVDKFFMAKWISISELGNFYRTRGLIDSITTQIGGIFDTVLFPILSNIQDNRDSIQNAFAKCMNLGCIFFSFLFLSFFFNAKLIIYIFLGEKWLDEIVLFRILSFSMLFYFITRLADCFIRSLALVKFGFYVTCMSCLMLISTIYLSIKFGYGSIGVAIAVVFTNLVSAIIKAIYICKYTKIDYIIVTKRTIRGFYYSLPIICVGFFFLMCYDYSFVNSILFLFVFLIISVLVFLFFPSYVGKTYHDHIYPYIISLLKFTNNGKHTI